MIIYQLNSVEIKYTDRADLNDIEVMKAKRDAVCFRADPFEREMTKEEADKLIAEHGADTWIDDVYPCNKLARIFWIDEIDIEEE